MKLYNTLTRRIEEISDDKISIYTCGLTVYSQPHIGNWLGYIYWDILVRTLRFQNIPVTRVQNYTDVGHLTSDDDNGEDKMEKGARREGITAWDVANKYIEIADKEGYTTLGLVRPDVLARATDYIQQQQAFVEVLMDKGYLYEIPADGLYFDTSKDRNYGALAQLDIEGLEAGARVSVEGRRNITDFAVWKYSPKDQSRDMEWVNPCGIVGKGFPGWHLECSVIARETLGDQITIHTGGIDHIPVHHSNEIAQTEAVTEKKFSQFWIHNNHLKVDGAKMSKSLGNIYTLQDLISKGFTAEDFRMFALGKHYRTEGNFTWQNQESAHNRLTDLYALAALRFQTQPVLHDHATFAFSDTANELIAIINHDLHTESALAYLSEVSKMTQIILVSNEDKREFEAMLQTIDDILGLNLMKVTDITKAQKQLIAEREHTRQVGDWAKSDVLRDELESMNVGIRDTKDFGAIWFPLRPL